MAEPQAKPAWRRFLPLAVILALALGVYLSGAHRLISLSELSARFADLQAYVAAYPLRSALLFAGAYALAVAISVPGALWFTIAAGAVFGWANGALVAWAGATTGAVIVFYVVKNAAGQGWAGALFGKRAQGILTRLRDGLQKREFLYLVLTRVVPLPFFAVNVASALAGARLVPYAAATALGIIPGTLAYAALGASVGDAIAAGQPIDASLLNVVRDPKVWGAFAIVAVLTLVAHRAEKWRTRLEQTGP